MRAHPFETTTFWHPFCTLCHEGEAHESHHGVDTHVHGVDCKHVPEYMAIGAIPGDCVVADNERLEPKFEGAVRSVRRQVRKIRRKVEKRSGR